MHLKILNLTSIAGGYFSLKLQNKKTAAVFIADHIRAKGEESIFLKKYAGKILKEEIAAAKFLVAAELV